MTVSTLNSQGVGVTFLVWYNKLNELITDHNAIETDIGDLSTLTTVDKDSVVEAINEVNAGLDNLTDDVGSLAALTTTDKDSIVDAINEVDANADAIVASIGSAIQPYSTALASIAGLTTAANQLIYTTALNTYDVSSLTDFARTILDDTDATAVRSTLGLVIGTNVQAYSAALASIAGLTTAANRMIYTTGANTYAVTDLSAFIRTLLDDADAATARGTLGAVGLTGDENVAGLKRFSDIVTINAMTSPPVYASADILRIERDAGAGMHLGSGDANSCWVYFGDSVRGVGGMLYSHAADTLQLRAKNAFGFNLGNGVWGAGATGTDKGAGTCNFTELYKNGVKASGAIIDRAYAQNAGTATLSTVLPFDDTVPTIAEGTQILTASITPKSTTNRIKVTFTGFGTHAASGARVIAAIFRGSTCIQVVVGNIEQPQNLSCVVEDTPNTTSATTYSVRVGAPTGNCFINASSISGDRVFGGAAKAVLVLEEIVP